MRGRARFFFVRNDSHFLYNTGLWDCTDKYCFSVHLSGPSVKYYCIDYIARRCTMYQLVAASQLFFPGHLFERFEDKNVPPAILECCRTAFHFWRPRACKTAGALGILAVALFCSATVPGIVEHPMDDFLPVVALLLVAALIVSVLA